MPLTSNRDSDARKFLDWFVDWIERWQSQNTEGKLTKEAFIALSHTCRALLEIAEYCLEELGVARKISNGCPRSTFWPVPAAGWQEF